MGELRTMTFSSARTFLQCRRRYYWRYIRELVPDVESYPLRFGSAVHDWLGAMDKGVDPFVTIAAMFPEWTPEKAIHIGLAEAAIGIIGGRVKADAVEKTFEIPLTNPATGASSRSFVFSGKADAILSGDGALTLRERKTTSLAVDGSYIDRLTMDLQTTAYCALVEEATGDRVSDISYEVFQRCLLRMKEGETEEEFEARKAELEAKSKTGKPSKANRKTPETQEEFMGRVRAWHREASRITIIPLAVNADDKARSKQVLWDVGQEMLDAHRNNRWTQNVAGCMSNYGKCPYWSICVSRDSDTVINCEYRHKAAHNELVEEPVF
jgi:hypothetical protein